MAATQDASLSGLECAQDASVSGLERAQDDFWVESVEDELGVAESTRHGVLAALEEAFGVAFSTFDGRSGELLVPSPEPRIDWEMFGFLCRIIAQRGEAEIVWEEDPFVFLAVPFVESGASCQVAVGAFVSRRMGTAEDLAVQSGGLAANTESLRNWAAQQTPWAPESLLRVSRSILKHCRQSERLESLQQDMAELSVHLAAVYKEIGLLYRLTRDLRLSKSDEDLARAALRWLSDAVPTRQLGLLLLPMAEGNDGFLGSARTKSVLLSTGAFAYSPDDFLALMEHFKVKAAADPVVENFGESPFVFGSFPIHNLIAVPVAEGNNLFGFLAALNHSRGGNFGSTEANLLQSVACILGVHSSNIDLCRQQAELMAGIAKALTSAIDTKDPYTCGHSDRVARLAVRLARELGYPPKMVSRVYLAGLLHDVGKIGVNDAVLQKAAKLTEAEFELIKNHVQTGFKILSGLKKLEDVNQAVLHHHEAWDGSGYPQRLCGEAIPAIARIVAVADAYDAMASDRPYRSRMPDDTIDQIIRNGAGRQWDPAVVEAFFRAREDLRRIVEEKDRGPVNQPLLGSILHLSTNCWA